MTDINFSSIAVGTNIPANYQGFQWAAYNPDGSYSGAVEVSDSASVHVIRNLGFQIVGTGGGDFTVVTITAGTWLGIPLDFNVVGYKDGDEVYNTPIRSDNGNTFSVPSNVVDKFEVHSNAMEIFEISAISVTV